MVDATEIRQFIVETFLFGDENRLANDTSLREQDIIDSTGMLEFITFLEDRFGVAIGDEDLVPENFDSIDKIVSLLEAKGSADDDSLATEVAASQGIKCEVP